MCRFCDIKENGIGKMIFPIKDCFVVLDKENNVLINYNGEIFKIPVKSCPICEKRLDRKPNQMRQSLRAYRDLVCRPIKSSYLLENLIGITVKHSSVILRVCYAQMVTKLFFKRLFCVHNWDYCGSDGNEQFYICSECYKIKIEKVETVQ